MLTGRGNCLAGSLLVIFLAGCENGDPSGPITGRQTRDPAGTYATPLNSSTVQVGWTDSSPNEIGFRIERSATGTSPWAVAGTTARDVTSFSDAGRSAEEQVCYRVFAVFRNGLSNASNTSCTIPPAAPSGLTATPVDHQAVDLAWTDNSAVEDGYQIERATAQAGPYSPVAFVAPNTTRLRQSGLTTNATYWYRVLANNDGGFSDASNLASATPVFTVPIAPSNLSARPGGDAVYLNWVDNATNEDGFRVERSVDQGNTWTTVVTLSSRDQTRTYDYNGLLEQALCYRVVAYNAQGASLPSNTVCTALPAVPSELTAAANDQPAIDLSWHDNSNVEDGYRVWRHDRSNVSSIVAELPANSTSYHDAAVSADQPYWYQVQATKDGGTSYSSNVASAIVLTGPPAAPSGMTVTASSSAVAALTWINNSSSETGFRVERSSDGGTSWVAAGTTGANETRFNVGGQPSEQPLCYRVFAFNDRGDSPPSNPDCITLPAGPTNLIAAGVEPQTIDLTWTDNSAVETRYEVWAVDYYCGDYDEWGNCIWFPYYSLVTTLGPNATSYRVSGLTSGYTFIYVVVALTDRGQSDLSNEVSGFVP
jgi:fibronectin type 3 domain-containing protein